MHFQNERQRETYGNVREYIGELFEDAYHDRENGHFYVSYGSTVLEISVDAYGPEEAIVTIMSYCVQEVDLDPELLLGLLELNHTLPFGGFSLVGQDIFFSETLFGRNLDRNHLLSAIGAVANLSDEYDDRIVAKYGGQRALDRIRDTGGRKKRERSLKK